MFLISFYTTGMVGVSYGNLKKPLNLFSSHTELGSLVRPIVSAVVHGKTRWRTDFHGSLDIEMFEFIIFSNAQIEISINWCMERGQMNLHLADIIVAFCSFGSFSCKSWCKVKSTLLRGTPGPPFEGGPPHERVSRTVIHVVTLSCEIIMFTGWWLTSDVISTLKKESWFGSFFVGGSK